MDMALMIAKSGLDAHHKSIEVISNNLANANTTAFKANRASFEDLPYQVITPPGAPTTDSINSPGSIVMGSGVRISDNSKNMTDGGTLITNKDKDVKITGRGFFQVQLPNGSDFAYTRAGSFMINEQGQLTLPNGYLLQPAITIPQGVQEISISQDGVVSIIPQGSTLQQTVGTIQLGDFINPDALQPIGQNLYIETTASGTVSLNNPTQNGVGMLTQGQLEGSNVNVVEEMVNLIEAQRAFEVTSKAISAVDNMLNYLNQAT